MDASDLAPPQHLTTNRHIPPEILEIILLNLPAKSLLRFSSVSKSWYSLIFGSHFVNNFRRQRIVLTHPKSFNNLSSCPVSAVSPDSSSVDTEALVSPFGLTSTRIAALCDELWCVEDTTTNSLFLWNLSIRTYVELPDPLRRALYCVTKFGLDDFDCEPMPYNYVYGLGYDSIHDDYKILKVGLQREFHVRNVELYSLRSDSWREIEPFPGDVVLEFTGTTRMGVSSSGALHWVVVPGSGWGMNTPHLSVKVKPSIVSFDLSDEEYGRVELPDFDRATNIPRCSMEIVALRGKLCLSLNYWNKRRFVLWVMEDYGVVGSWTKEFDVDGNVVPGFGYGSSLRPLFCLYDDGDIVISRKYVCGKMDIDYGKHIASKGGKVDIFVYENGETLISKSFGTATISDCFVYFESLVSPALWRGRPRT